MSSPSEGIRDLLVSQSVGTFNTDTGWSIHISRQVDDPDTVISVYDSGGRSPNPQWLVDYPTVQVRVRGGENDYLAAHTKCRDVVNALIGLPSQDINRERWDSISQNGGINFLGYDEKKRPQFSLNFALIIEPASGTHRESLC